MKTVPTTSDTDMLAEYDFSTGTRGKYALRYADGAGPGVAEVFPDTDLGETGAHHWRTRICHIQL